MPPPPLPPRARAGSAPGTTRPREHAREPGCGFLVRDAALFRLGLTADRALLSPRRDERSCRCPVPRGAETNGPAPVPVRSLVQERLRHSERGRQCKCRRAVLTFVSMRCMRKTSVREASARCATVHAPVGTRQAQIWTASDATILEPRGPTVGSQPPCMGVSHHFLSVVASTHRHEPVI